MACVACLGVGLLAVGGSGVAATSDGPTDSLTPTPQTLTLGVGTSKTVHSTLHLEALPPKADILLAVDTTGSMGQAISDVQHDATSIVQQIHQSIHDAQFAVADFKDYNFSPFGFAADYPWRIDQPFTINPDAVCSNGGFTIGEIQCALSGLSAPAGSGNDNPEAYNRAFYEAYSDSGLGWEPGAARFMIVLGDSLPHDQNLHSDFSACPATSPTDPGSAFDDGYGDVGPLHTLATLQGLKNNHTNLSFVTYNPSGIDWGNGFTTFGCQQQLAQYTGGTAIVHGDGTDSLGTQIVNLINQSASQIDSINLNVTGTPPAPDANFQPASWFTFNPPITGPAVAPTDIGFDETVNVPQNAPLGTYQFHVTAVADGVQRATQDVTVNVTPTGVSSLQMTSDDPSVPAGIKTVPYGSIPGSRLAALTPDVGSAAAGSIAAGSIAAGSIAAGSIAAGSIAAGSIAAGSIAAGSIAAGSIGFGPIAAGSIAAGSIPAGGAALKSVLLSEIPLVGTTWADILKDSPFATQPLQAVTLYDVANYGTAGSDGKTPWQRLMVLPLRQVPFFTSLWRTVPFGAVLLGNAKLSDLPTPLKPDGSHYASWAAALDANGGDSTGVTGDNTVFGVAISGQLGTTAVGSIAAGSIAAGSIASGSIAAGSIAAGSIAAGSIDLRATSLGTIPLTHLTDATIVTCGTSFDCTGKTLGDASAANAIRPDVTLAYLLDHIDPAVTVTIDQIAQAMLPLSDYPWEQINVQGLQDVAGLMPHVHYHVDFDLVCSVASSFALHAKLPAGFFPVAGSSQFSYAGGAAVPATDPTGPPSDPVWTPPGVPCAGGTATRHVQLSFESYAGLTLGSKTSDVFVTANDSTYSASNQAPVLVNQNWEPNGDPATAPTIEKNTLVVGHIATASDTDYFRFPLDNLPSGTKVAVYLKVPHGTDLDLVVQKPASAGPLSTASGSIAAGSIAAGSIAAGSIPIEDSGPGVDNSHGALQPDAAADIAAGSIPPDSTAAGSIAAGSISANRGDVNEVAQIVTRGETGAAVIGVSGYNSAFSSDPFVLRVKVTPPPPQPPCDAATGLATATPGTLPAVNSLPTSTKALFLVNRQRLVGLYGETRTNALLNSSSSSPLNAVAAQVGGQVLQVDGNATVRSAYAAWDQNPCNLDNANTVVRSINDLVATYRARLPNLKYVVLLGSDQVEPSWRQQDLTAVSPEVDEANDLAFTTLGLTKGNEIYATAAQNAVLTDGAYGAFTPRTWLGHSLPLPDVSVSRVVETPEDINGQLSQYLAATGKLDLHTSLTTGDSFFSDGADAASSALGTQLGITDPANLNKLLTPTTLWTRQMVLDKFFNKSPVPDVGALWAHYSHWVAQPASLSSPPVLSDFLTTGDINTAHPLNGRLLFTVGCHSGLNVPDTLMRPLAPADFGSNQQRFLDWAQAYMQARAAVYVANTGFGYGDTTTIDLSERLMDHFANNINSGGTIGEQWVRALHQYYSEPSNYDVIDEKVMVEANMYGLPFYGFSGTPVHVPTAPTPPTHAVENGVDTAHLPAIAANIQAASPSGPTLFVDPNHPDGSTYTDANGVPLTTGTLSVFYRPAQPTVSRDVTVPGETAHGVWVNSLTTHTLPGVQPYKPFPLVHSADDLPAVDYPNIFFPAAVATINRDVTFGTEHDTAVVNLGRFYPNDTGNLGTEQVVDSVGLDVGYSNSTDSTPPEIFQTQAVQTGDRSFIAFVRASDASGLHRVAVLYHENGDGHWHVLELQHASGDLWTGNITTTALGPIQLDSEAQDNAGNVGYSFNKAVNFTSVPDSAAPRPSILIDAPLPAGTFTLNQQVPTQFTCSSTAGISSCTGATDGGSSIQSGGMLDTSKAGTHTFTVAAEDLAGNASTRSVTYVVLFNFGGFLPPVNNPPTLNTVKAGSIVPLKWSLFDQAGNAYANMNAVQSISSRSTRCLSATKDPVETLDTVIGTSGVSGVDAGVFHYNWATDKTWAGTCRTLFVHLSDGTTPTANFQFTN